MKGSISSVEQISIQLVDWSILFTDFCQKIGVIKASEQHEEQQ